MLHYGSAILEELDAKYSSDDVDFVFEDHNEHRPEFEQYCRDLERERQLKHVEDPVDQYETATTVTNTTTTSSDSTSNHGETSSSPFPSSCGSASSTMSSSPPNDKSNTIRIDTMMNGLSPAEMDTEEQHMVDTELAKIREYEMFHRIVQRKHRAHRLLQHQQQHQQHQPQAQAPVHLASVLTTIDPSNFPKSYLAPIPILTTDNGYLGTSNSVFFQYDPKYNNTKRTFDTMMPFDCQLLTGPTPATALPYQPITAFPLFAGSGAGATLHLVQPLPFPLMPLSTLTNSTPVHFPTPLTSQTNHASHPSAANDGGRSMMMMNSNHQSHQHYNRRYNTPSPDDGIFQFDM